MQMISHNKHATNVHPYERAASIAAGTLLAFKGLRSRRGAGYVLALAGAELLRRGATGRSYAYELLGFSTAPRGTGAALPYPLGIRADCSVKINRPVEEVYQFWRRLENLPQCMEHLESVETLSPTRSRWAARAPGGTTVEWEAELINDIPNELIAWRSVEGAAVAHAGSVHFRSTNGGTRVRVELQYNPPAGIAGAKVASLLGEEPSQRIQGDLYRLKEALERTTPRGIAAAEQPLGM
jgi:uncharacterized membrane protein